MIWSDRDHTMKAIYRRASGKRIRNMQWKVQWSGWGHPHSTSENQETHGLKIKDDNFSDLQHLCLHHWKTYTSLEFFFSIFFFPSGKSVHTFIEAESRQTTLEEDSNLSQLKNEERRRGCNKKINVIKQLRSVFVWHFTGFLKEEDRRKALGIMMGMGDVELERQFYFSVVCCNRFFFPFLSIKWLNKDQ